MNGKTRSARQPTHLLHTPDTFVRTPMPGVEKGAVIVHASPALGAEFLWFTLELEAGGRLAASEQQRFVYLLTGDALISHDDAETHLLHANEFSYIPEGAGGAIVANSATRAVVIEKRVQPFAGGEPRWFAGEESAMQPEPLNGDPDLLVRALVPAGLVHDFAVNTMTYAPGATLSQVEIHYMEHGLLMLEGGGTYVLNDRTYEVQAGDFIWMQAYCPQWFQASGDGPAKYLIYKDFNRKPGL